MQIQVYYDDFETSDPLGSKQGIHKLGCLYFTLRNLPPRLNSSRMNIHLISLFHSQDAKKYGIDQILTPFVEDVKVLESNGMKVSFAEQPVFWHHCTSNRRQFRSELSSWLCRVFHCAPLLQNVSH